MRFNGFGRRRWIWTVVALTFVLAVIAGAKVGANTDLAAKRRPVPDAVATDIDISGPFLQNLAKDPHSTQSAIRCGEPEITQDTRNPNTLFVDCAADMWLNYQSSAPSRYFDYGDPRKTDLGRPCYTFVSRDRGNTWNIVNPAPLRSAIFSRCFDALADHGPHGELYLGGDAAHTPATGQYGVMVANVGKENYPWETLGIGFTRSLDGGKTWSVPIAIPTQDDRPFWTVDQSTGVIFDVSGCTFFNLSTKRGGYGCTPTSRNLAVSTDQGRTWGPSVDMKTANMPTDTLTPGHLHNIEPYGANAIGAALGVFAAAGVENQAEPDEEEAAGPANAKQGAQAAPKAVLFQYSTDNGVTFTHRRVPFDQKLPCSNPTVSGLSADPTHRGSFAIIVVCGPNAQAVRVLVTHDFGSNWTEPADLASVPPSDYSGHPSPFGVNRASIGFGPTGKLGVMWRQAYCGDTAMSPCPSTGAGKIAASGCCAPGPQDVFVAISTDGGTSFGSPVRLNTAASPSPDPRQWSMDDISDVILDKEFAYVVWGDWRSGEMEVWFRKVPLH